jgi:hypothetical protein
MFNNKGITPRTAREDSASMAVKLANNFKI